MMGKQLIMSYNRPRNQLWKISHKAGVIQETIGRSLPFISINHKGKLLKGKKADAQRKQN